MEFRDLTVKELKHSMKNGFRFVYNYYGFDFTDFFDVSQQEADEYTDRVVRKLNKKSSRKRTRNDT